MSAADMAKLRTVLSASSNETQRFIQPLLPLKGVQELLLTFVQDSTRTFEDWVWDPQVRQSLVHMRDFEPQTRAQGHEFDQWYMQAAKERLEAIALQEPDDVTPREFLAEADTAQSDGKVKFQEKNYYAAKNAFLKSISAILKHQQSEYYGKSLPPIEWEDSFDLQERYVQLCNNVAICGLKMKDLAIMNEYAAKALTVEKRSIKALYVLIKVRLWEHRYDEASEIVTQALSMYPEKGQFLNLFKEIKAAERRHAVEQARMSEIRAKQLHDAMTAASVMPRVVTQEEREQQRLETRQVKEKKTPLPTREDDLFAAARLYRYFSTIKQQMMVEILPCYEADKGEMPLFKCTIVHGGTGDVLAADVRAISKKLAKNEASKLAIEKLWSDKQKAGTLTLEDLTYLEKFQALNASTPQVDDKGNEALKGAIDNKPQLPMRVTWLDRQLQPVALLNQLTQRHALEACFDITDVSPSKEVTEFNCTGILNGETIATATGVSKKKARNKVASLVLAAAFEKNLIVKYDEPTDEKKEEKKIVDGKTLEMT
ncbi:hypothetical protein CCR75_007538 [Bremia lactucae]|uniref:DRBM domain-containing protein n=1 Tax=Bremia lactucae TaxID=4779 RepID=A0A976FGZ9_BRELC|nr:hypothetical protein CCR75_007538 [Bremia lactucae]